MTNRLVFPILAIGFANHKYQNLQSSAVMSQRSGFVISCNSYLDKLYYAIKSPRPLQVAFDSERFLITDKHTDILGCIPCVMVIFHVLWCFCCTRQAKPKYAMSLKRTDGRYQTYYLPCFAVDKYALS